VSAPGMWMRRSGATRRSAPTLDRVVALFFKDH
jgi:hypothetical protein